MNPSAAELRSDICGVAFICFVIAPLYQHNEDRAWIINDGTKQKKRIANNSAHTHLLNHTVGGGGANTHETDLPSEMQHWGFVV